MMKVSLMWTINDLPAYGMLSTWMTFGRLSCPICIKRTKALYLNHIHKISFFDCLHQFLSPDHPFRKNKKHSGRSLLRLISLFHACLVLTFGIRLHTYQFALNYKNNTIFMNMVLNIIGRNKVYSGGFHIRKLNLCHNIDVMHIERNVFMNVFDTVMDIKGKTMNINNARLDVAQICNKRELELKDIDGDKLMKPKAIYAFTKSQIVSIYKWVKELKFPYGYASNLDRCVDLNQRKLHGIKFGIKVHDCHVFMSRFIPIAFDTLPKSICKVVVELSLFFRELSSTTLNVEYLRVMKENIPSYCVLEQIFPPSFFAAMEHFPIHLPLRQKLVVQYNIVGCIHLRGIKLLITFISFVVYVFNIFNDVCPC